MTRWLFGTTLADSGVATGNLLRAKIYPESDDEHNPLGDGPGGEYERIEYGSNRQGDVIRMTDPNGTVHEYDFNKLGKQTQDRITTFGSGIDDAVKRIATGYNNRGLPEKITSYDNATVGSGNVLNEVVREYDDFGQLQEDKQSHSGAVTGGTPKVGYGHEDGSSGNTARRKSITYPDGRTIDIGYGSANSADDLMSRIASLKINGEGSNLADYIYLGLSMLVKAAYPQPGVDLSYIKTASDPVGDAGDPYTGYDRFNRSVDLRWAKTSGGALLDEWLYGYNRASQRTWKSNYAATAGDNQDDFYHYDGLYQVTRAARGELNLNHTAIGAIPVKEEMFLYDPTGNWNAYVEKSDGMIDLDQTRKNNKDNQITQVDGSSEDIAYDKAGNAIKMLPDAAGDWSEHYQLKWDGWDRLVEVKDSVGAVVAAYAYDGLTRRITKTIGAVVTHFYYNDQWKVVEERKDSSTDADRQYAWGIQFRNDLILRDRDTTGNGTLDERLYATHDALGNCTAILNTSGAVQERYGYSAFGVRRIMQADFGARANSSFAWDFAFQGEFLDDETGYINYGYRMYLPYIGRWINRDPLEEEGANNLYGFVSNNVVNIVDYLGLWTCDQCKDQCDKCFPKPGDKDQCLRDCQNSKLSMNCGHGPRSPRGGATGPLPWIIAIRPPSDANGIYTPTSGVFPKDGKKGRDGELVKVNKYNWGLRCGSEIHDYSQCCVGSLVYNKIPRYVRDRQTRAECISQRQSTGLYTGIKAGMAAVTAAFGYAAAAGAASFTATGATLTAGEGLALTGAAAAGGTVMSDVFHPLDWAAGGWCDEKVCPYKRTGDW